MRKAIITEDDYIAIKRVMEGDTGGVRLAAFAALDRIKGTFDAYEPATIERAQELCSDGKVEVDDGAVISRGDDSGAYVMAWLWVPDEDGDEDEDDDPS